MNNKRRDFLRVGSLLSGTTLLSNPLDLLAKLSKKVNTLAENNTLMVYQTNDLLSRLKAIYNDRGGLQAVKNLINQQELSGLMVDAGNFMTSAESSQRHEQNTILRDLASKHKINGKSQAFLVRIDNGNEYKIKFLAQRCGVSTQPCGIFYPVCSAEA